MLSIVLGCGEDIARRPQIDCAGKQCMVREHPWHSPASTELARCSACVCGCWAIACHGMSWEKLCSAWHGKVAWQVACASWVRMPMQAPCLMQAPPAGGNKRHQALHSLLHGLLPVPRFLSAVPAHPGVHAVVRGCRGLCAASPAGKLLRRGVGCLGLRGSRMLACLLGLRVLVLAWLTPSPHDRPLLGLHHKGVARLPNARMYATQSARR